MSSQLSRRSFLVQATAVVSLGGATPVVRALAEPAVPADPANVDRSRAIEGLLVGSLIGDAMGGPIEFDERKLADQYMPNLRDWPDARRLMPRDLGELATTLPLLGYEELRPDTAPYGPWTERAAVGTVTDDTRHKMILIDALRQVRRTDASLDVDDLAAAYLRWDAHPCFTAHPDYRPLSEEGFAEFRLAARWVLGDRDRKRALPPERIWGGVPTCCGQMTLLPLAAAYASQPEQAYLATYRLGFFDNSDAKDINSALVAGLSVALTTHAAHDDLAGRRKAWQQITQTMQQVDPYRYGQMPYVTRPVSQWLDFAHRAVREADGVPKRLYRSLEEDCRVRHWWEAHLIFTIMLACLEFCDYDPLASLHMVLDFGHDADSAAQLLGAFVGALHGPAVFPAAFRSTVRKRLAEDYVEDLDEWVGLLATLGDRARYPQVVRIDDESR